MQNAMWKTVACAVIFVMMAALLGGQPTNPAAVGETVDMVQEVNAEAEPHRSAWLWSRHSLKRHERRLNLIERRQRRRFRRALIRVLPTLLRDERRTARRAAVKQAFAAIPGAVRGLFERREIEPQCVECGVHQDDGFAIDTTLKPAQCIDCFTESEGLRAYAPLIVAVLCAAVVGLIFDPQTAAPLAIVGRASMPQWAKDAAKKHEVKIRRHEKGRKTVACAGCLNGIESGDIKAMLPASGYTQNKPHCEACAKVRLAAADVPAVPQPTPEPTPEPTPTPTPTPTTTRPPNRKAGQCAVCGVDVAAGVGHIHTESPRGHKVRCSAHAETPHGTPPSDEPTPTPAAIPNGDPAAQIAALLAQLTAGGAVDEAAVRRIVREEYDDQTSATLNILHAAIDNAQNAKSEALQAVEERLKELHAPTVLHIKTDNADPIPAADEGEIIHRQEREVLAKISALSRRNRAQNLMLVGEAGTGKTHMAEGVFKRLLKIGFFKGMESAAVCHVESCNEEKQPSDLMGRLSPAFFDDGSGTPSGAWRFFAGAVMKAFCSPGVLVFDEMDTLAPPSFSALNAMLANGFIIDPDGVRHYRHPRCVVIATANTRGNGANDDYTASHAQSLASLDRFAAGFVDVDFDPAIEDALAPSIADDIRALRILAKERRCRRVVFSYRVMMNAQALAEDFGKEYAMSETVFQFGAENAALLGFDERVALPDDVPFDGLAPMSAKARKAAEKVRSASFSMQSFNADTTTDNATAGGA